MNKLMKARAWSNREFEKGSEPDSRTIKKWVENGIIMGRIMDGHTYIYSSEKMGVDSLISQAVRDLIRD